MSKRCPHCGKMITEQVSFCPECGNKVEETGGKYCKKCGAELGKNDVFCKSCGTQVGPFLVKAGVRENHSTENKSYISFVQETVLNLNADLFCELKNVLIGEYLSLSLAEKEDLLIPTLAEKLCDYFEILQLKTGRTFEKIVEKYMADLDTVVGKKIAKAPTPKKNGPSPVVPRARKYYEKACSLRKNNQKTKTGLLDYSRIMLCLYAAIAHNNRKEIKDFNFSMKELNLKMIIEALKNETVLNGKKTKDIYTLNRSSFILLIIMFYYMKTKEIIGEY